MRASGSGTHGKRKLAVLAPVLLLMAGIGTANAGEPAGTQVMFSAEVLVPTDGARRLDTSSFDLLLRIKSLDKLRLSLLAGITATDVRGEITQLIGELEEGTLEEVVYESPGKGVGPSFLAMFDVFRKGGFTASLGAGGALILYDRDFPAGGKHHNFMWRIGPAFSYRVSRSSVLGLSYRWMHVSNGSGLGPQNPSYDARGMNLNLTVAF